MNTENNHNLVELEKINAQSIEEEKEKLRKKLEEQNIPYNLQKLDDGGFAVKYLEKDETQAYLIRNGDGHGRGETVPKGNPLYNWKTTIAPNGVAKKTDPKDHTNYLL